MNENNTKQALGMIEVVGRLGAIEALDAALKAANVRFVNMSKVGGGLTAVFVEGEVGAVKAATEAGGRQPKWSPTSSQSTSSHVLRTV